MDDNSFSPPTKILALMSSPRQGGNTEILFQKFLTGVAEHGGEVVPIMLREKKISPCLELYGCKESGQCVISDDFVELAAQLEACDKLVIFTPIFFSALPAQLKAVIDRCQAFYMRKYVLKQSILPVTAPRRPAYFVALGASNEKQLFDAAFLTLHHFLECLDMKLAGSLLYRNIEYPGDILQHPQALQEVYELGVSISYQVSGF